MAFTGKHLAYTMADLIATHQLLRFVRNDTEEERLRIVAGVTLAGLGFAYGSELEERIKGLHETGLSAPMKRQLMKSAGYAAIGAVAGYLGGPFFAPSEQHESETSELFKEALAIATPAKPGGILTVASAGWLGYSILFNTKRTQREEHNQLWGLGAGALGYLYGPEAIVRIKTLAIPEQIGQDAKRVYALGGALLGAAAGGAAGWQKATR